MTNPNLPITRKHTVDDLVDATLAALDVLRDDADEDAIPEEAIPGAAEAERWIREVWTDRGGDLRPRRSMPKGTSGPGRGLAGMLRWHGTGGTLDGLFIARWNAGADKHKVDLLATVIRIVGGASTPSPAMAAWARAGVTDPVAVVGG